MLSSPPKEANMDESHPKPQSASRGAARLAPMILLFVISFALYGLYCFGTVTKVKVNGPFYDRIVQGKDVIADILPPPAYLLETYLIAFQMFDDKDGSDLPKFMVEFSRSKDEYLARQAFWKSHLPEGELRKTLTETSFAPGSRMLEAIEKEFVPALQAGDRVRAENLLHGKIREEYDAHRAAIGTVVDLAVKRNREDEAGAAMAVKSRAAGQVGLGLMLIILLSFLSWRWVRGAETEAVGAPALPAGTGA
jgi:methyl-accepting chemotaxis protein